MYAKNAQEAIKLSGLMDKPSLRLKVTIKQLLSQKDFVETITGFTPIPIKMSRKPKPDAIPYLRRVLGIPLNVRILPANDLYRLEFAVAIVNFIGKEKPVKKAMADFIKEFAAENNVSTSFCYKIKAKLEELTLIRFDHNWGWYSYNHERYKRDLKALNKFHAQVKAW